MSVTMDPIKGGALFVEDQEYQMHTTAKSVPSKKKTVMDVQRLWIWVALKPIFFMNGKNMVSRGGEEAFELLYVLLIWIVRKSTCNYSVNQHTSAREI